MFGKKQPKTIDMSTGELLGEMFALKPVSLWTKVKYISVDSINGQHEYYKDASYRMTDNVLMIRDNKEHVFYNMNNVIKYYFEPEDSPPS